MNDIKDVDRIHDRIVRCTRLAKTFVAPACIMQAGATKPFRSGIPMTWTLDQESALTHVFGIDQTVL